MALLPKTGCETHPDGTVGIPGIVNGNWSALENTVGRLLPGMNTGATPAIDLNNSQPVQEIVLAADPTFTTTNVATGRSARAVIIRAGAATRALTWPAGWTWLQTAPTSLASGKTALLELWSTSGSNAGIVARFTVQP